MKLSGSGKKQNTSEEKFPNTTEQIEMSSDMDHGLRKHEVHILEQVQPL